MSVESLQAALSSGSLFALPLAFLGGVLVALNPCCLAFYPVAAGVCCAGGTLERTRSVAWSAAAFVAGTTVTTTAMGILAAFAGHAVVGLGPWPRYALAAVPLVMGTYLLGWLRLPLPGLTRGDGGGPGAAFAAGMLLALVVGSCGTPVLASILAFAAYQGNLLFGGALLFFYGLGNGVPLLILGTTAGELVRRVLRGKSQAWSERIAGAALVGLGFYLILIVP